MIICRSHQPGGAVSANSIACIIMVSALAHPNQHQQVAVSVIPAQDDVGSIAVGSGIPRATDAVELARASKPRLTSVPFRSYETVVQTSAGFGRS